jgi:hypothetical protein
MFSKRVDLRVFTDVSWWHWGLTIPLLAAHLAGYSWAIPIAMGLCGTMGLYFLLRLRRLRPYPVQVRIVYLGLLLIGTLPWMQWVHWVQLAGTTAMVTVGYCPLIRILSLAPLNRTKPLTPALVWRAFVQEPCAGGLISWSTGSPSPAIACCSLPTANAPLACSLPTHQSSPAELQHTAAH